MRVTGLHRGFVGTARDVGLRDAELDELIRRQRDWFAARGEAVEWRTRGRDLLLDLLARPSAGWLRARGDRPLAALSAQEPPPGVTIRQVSNAQNMGRVAAMQSQPWGENRGWLAAERHGPSASPP